MTSKLTPVGASGVATPSTRSSSPCRLSATLVVSSTLNLENGTSRVGHPEKREIREPFKGGGHYGSSSPLTLPQSWVHEATHRTDAPSATFHHSHFFLGCGPRDRPKAAASETHRTSVGDTRASDAFQITYLLVGDGKNTDARIRFFTNKGQPLTEHYEIIPGTATDGLDLRRWRKQRSCKMLKTPKKKRRASACRKS